MSCYFLLCFYCLLDMRSGECNVVCFCVALSMDLFALCVVCLTVFVNCLVKQFAICFGCVCYFLLLNVMGVVVWLEVLYWIDRVWSFNRMCVCCACGPSERPRCSFHMLCFCMSEVISSFRSFEN